MRPDADDADDADADDEDDGVLVMVVVSADDVGVLAFLIAAEDGLRMMI